MPQKHGMLNPLFNKLIHSLLVSNDFQKCNINDNVIDGDVSLKV